jgi:surface carbohydrate biosynthesis protein
MSRWLLLPVETKSREFHAKLLLAAVAAEAGYDVLLGEQNAMLAQLPALPAGIYIDKSIARTKTRHFRRLRAAGHRVVAWCEEGLVYRDRDAYLHERISPDSLAEVDRFFCWGQVQRDDIAGKIGAGKVGGDKLVLAGNPRFDLLRPGFRDLFGEAAAALNDSYGDYILINTNFARYNHFNGEGFLLDVLRQRGTLTTPEQETFYTGWRDFLGTLFHGFAQMMPVLSRAFPDRTIVLRPHPSENHQRWAELTRDLPNVKVVYQGNVVPWLMASPVLVHNSCTTGLESFLLDRPALAFRPATSETFDSYLPNAVSRSVWRADELVEEVRAALANGAVAKDAQADAVAARYYAATDGALAAERVTAALDDVPPAEARPAAPSARLKARAAPLRELARRLLRPRQAAYARQKFPGLDLAETQAELARLAGASGRFGRVRVVRRAWRCFHLRAA